MSAVTTPTVTLSSSGVSAAMSLDPTARTTTLMLIPGAVTSTSTQAATAAQVRIELTLDTWTPQNPTQFWQNASSLTYVIGSSGVNPSADGELLSILGPIAGARLNSTTWAPATGTLTLKALQSLTAGP